MERTIALVLAGGKGTRLEPLTRDRAKPAVPFGGIYRIIDFTLSNCINSGLRRILVLTQYKAASLDRHINLGWRFLCRELNEFIDILPPQQRVDEQWYRGTANAVYQNIYSIEQAGSQNVLILSGDHIYKMDYSELIEDHEKSGADVSIACLPVSISDGREFGVMQVNDDFRVTSFTEKPDSPSPMPGDSETCLASMGIYVFRSDFLFEELCRDATKENTSNDFGKDIIPNIIHKSHVRAFMFRDKNTKAVNYWKDVGTLDSFYRANMDLVSVEPLLNLYDSDWPIRNYHPPHPPAKFVFAQDEVSPPRVGKAIDSIVCAGSVISGGSVERSIISPNVRVNSWASVEDSILFERVNIGRHAKVKRAIIDKGVDVPEGATVGYDLAEDRRRGFTITEDGIVVIGKMSRFESNVVPSSRVG